MSGYTVGEILDERNWTADELAAILEERGVVSAKNRKPITVRGIQNMSTSPMPRNWAKALGIEPTPLAGDQDSSAGETESRGARPSGGGQRDERPPRKPDGAKTAAATQIAHGPGAQKRIAGAYKFVGAALATGAGNEGVAVVFGDQSEEIAKLWIEAAQDNPWAARFVQMMEAGGTAGDLIGAHLYLAGATFYVLGAGIPAGDMIFAKYSRHRPRRPEPAAPDIDLGHEPTAPDTPGDVYAASDPLG